MCSIQIKKQVILPAIHGHVPEKMVHAMRDFLDFAYLVRRSVISEDDLRQLDLLVARFQENREIFRELGVRLDGFSLPRQHSMAHYSKMIRKWGAPNGLCSSITESKHIKAVKKPYRRSSKYEALGQMLVINQRIDKLHAARTIFTAHGLLKHGPADESEGLQPHAGDVLGSSEESFDEEDSVDTHEVDEPAGLGDVKLAKTAGASSGPFRCFQRI
jgi:hypothetical protein